MAISPTPKKRVEGFDGPMDSMDSVIFRDFIVFRISFPSFSPSDLWFKSGVEIQVETVEMNIVTRRQPVHSWGPKPLWPHRLSAASASAHALLAALCLDGRWATKRNRISSSIILRTFRIWIIGLSVTHLLVIHRGYITFDDQMTSALY